ncbi:MAG TPA: L-rhamnose/proton symporter RhaT [Chitinophagaceae bacterium]|jgi:L-rhamnose-H+ transport protein|nr:L-rhamnose/proton symporter RhaT [Chitinophagaceae bacterium]
MELLNGILYHTVGASSAALCYTPQKKVKGWSWQTYWLAQASICWLILPIVVAIITIPDLSAVLNEAPSGAMWKSFGLGMAYGIGGTAFGMAIRYVGFSLTYAIAVGISCILGSLLPPLINGEFNEFLQSNGSVYHLGGVGLGVIGIACCGVAGRKKELELAQRQQQSTSGFSLAKGLPLCILAGVLSAFYGLAIDQGAPIAKIAAEHKAGEFQNNVIYIFSNSGAFLTTLIYCLYLHSKQKTFGEYNTPTDSSASLPLNYGMALLTGILWYGQFFFYGLGAVRMGDKTYMSWAIHMLLLVLLSSITGLLLKEWKGISKKTTRMLLLALLILTIAVLLITYGKYKDV